MHLLSYLLCLVGVVRAREGFGSACESGEGAVADGTGAAQVLRTESRLRYPEQHFRDLGTLLEKRCRCQSRKM